MTTTDNIDWDKAKRHLDEVRRIYCDIGAAGILGLTLTLNPLLVRYELQGERSQELYDEMMRAG